MASIIRLGRDADVFAKVKGFIKDTISRLEEEAAADATEKGIMLCYASNVPEDCMPRTHSVATHLGHKFTGVRRATSSGGCVLMADLGHHGVVQKADISVEPQRIRTVVSSAQLAEPSKEMTAQSMRG